MTDDRVVERLPPAEAFGLLAHETRVRAVQVLDEADGPLSFGELRQRVGVDDPGQFNYHLGKLTGQFARNGEDGYELTVAGRRVAGAILSGGFTKAMDAAPAPVDGSCDICGGDLVARFEADCVRITCSDCGFDKTAPKIPPGVVEGWDREEVPGVVHRWVRRKHVSGACRLCPNCDGRIDRAVYLPGEDGAPDWFDGHLSEADVVSRCQRCDHSWHALVEYSVLVEPAVVAFHHEHGVDLRETPTWELDWLETRVATVLREDPLHVAVPVTLDGETRSFVFDRDLSLVKGHAGQPFTGE